MVLEVAQFFSKHTAFELANISILPHVVHPRCNTTIRQLTVGSWEHRCVIIESLILLVLCSFRRMVCKDFLWPPSDFQPDSCDVVSLHTVVYSHPGSTGTLRHSYSCPLSTYCNRNNRPGAFVGLRSDQQLLAVYAIWLSFPRGTLGPRH